MLPSRISAVFCHGLSLPVEAGFAADCFVFTKQYAMAILNPKMLEMQPSGNP
jgi:hypothetical protein